MMNDTKLKPCPFCGGEAELRYADNYYWVECKKCRTRSDEECVESFDRGHQKTIDVLAEMWNRRTEKLSISREKRYLKKRSQVY